MIEFSVSLGLALFEKTLANLGDLKACDHGRGEKWIAKLLLRALGSRPRPMDLLENVLARKLRCDLAIPARSSVNQRNLQFQARLAQSYPRGVHR